MSDPGLKGKFLIANPRMPDPRFAQSLILVCDHSSEGAMGVVVNKPMVGLEFDEVARQLDLKWEGKPKPTIYQGGPVSPERGFLLHTAERGVGPESLRVSGTLVLSAEVSLLREIAEGRGPRRFLFALGYAGWGPGQLETELEEDSWLVVPALDEIIFDVAVDQRWRTAALRHGIDPFMIADTPGNA